jgi:hypothetical protein
MSTLQQLQQSNPTEYKQVTAQIASSLQSAAQAANSQGNSTAANQLNQLATDFTNASQSGQLPNIQDLAQAVGGHHHHHHHHGGGGASSSTDADSSTSSTSTSTASTSSSSSTDQSVNQAVAAYQTSTAQNNPFNPTSIILSALSSAGINVSNA